MQVAAPAYGRHFARRRRPRRAAALLNYPDRPPAVALLDLRSSTWTTVKSSTEMIIDAASVSLAQTGQLD